MLNIALEDTVIICSKEYNCMKVEMKKLRVGVKFDNEIHSGLVSELECGNVKTSISNNLLGYPYVENKKLIRQKYQWKYWYFFIVISNQILIN